MILCIEDRKKLQSYLEQKNTKKDLEILIVPYIYIINYKLEKKMDILYKTNTKVEKFNNKFDYLMKDSYYWNKLDDHFYVT